MMHSMHGLFSDDVAVDVDDDDDPGEALELDPMVLPSPPLRCLPLFRFLVVVPVALEDIDGVVGMADDDDDEDDDPDMSEGSSDGGIGRL
mmetsp:Transcript_5407/g.14640  ORF Transcript_5407/g.14640 Transcript_5407/m.14640 type:complete len:90 (-) Transcript_5407:290-559(-)